MTVPRVLHVIAPAPYGGAESVIRALVRASREKGADTAVALLLQLPEPHPFAGVLRADGVPVEEIRCGRRRYLAEARALAQLLVRTQPAVVHTHGFHADLVGYRAARLAGVPAVSTAHGFVDSDLKGRFYQWLDVRALRRFDAVICVSENVRGRVVGGGADPSRVHLVPNAVLPAPQMGRAEARGRLGLEPDARVVGWVGRLSREKGPDLLLESVRRLDRDVTAVLVGDGPERTALEALAASFPMGRVRLVGSQPDASRLLEAFDMVAITSRTEGTPMVLLESMAAGIPVVAFGVGGIPAVVGPTEAVLVVPGDVDGMTAGITAVLDDPAAARARAEAARDAVRRGFGVDAWLARLSTIYGQVATP